MDYKDSYGLVEHYNPPPSAKPPKGTWARNREHVSPERLAELKKPRTEVPSSGPTLWVRVSRSCNKYSAHHDEVVGMFLRSITTRFPRDTCCALDASLSGASKSLLALVTANAAPRVVLVGCIQHTDGDVVTHAYELATNADLRRHGVMMVRSVILCRNNIEVMWRIHQIRNATKSNAPLCIFMKPSPTTPFAPCWKSFSRRGQADFFWNGFSLPMQALGCPKDTKSIEFQPCKDSCGIVVVMMCGTRCQEVYNRPAAQCKGIIKCLAAHCHATMSSCPTRVPIKWTVLLQSVGTDDLPAPIRCSDTTPLDIEFLWYTPHYERVMGATTTHLILDLTPWYSHLYDVGFDSTVPVRALDAQRPCILPSHPDFVELFSAHRAHPHEESKGDQDPPPLVAALQDLKNRVHVAHLHDFENIEPNVVDGKLPSAPSAHRAGHMLTECVMKAYHRCCALSHPLRLECKTAKFAKQLDMVVEKVFSPLPYC